ncbi:MAG: pyrroloquinoline quinone biosynthesis peptide chaperone PqqD [Alphaproteobacteria bacterium]
MNAVSIAATSCPALARGVKMRFDEARQQWMLNAPERVLMLDEIAQVILSRCDGAISINALCRELALEFAAPQEIIQADVMEMMADMLHRGFIRI